MTIDQNYSGLFGSLDWNTLWDEVKRNQIMRGNGDTYTDRTTSPVLSNLLGQNLSGGIHINPNADQITFRDQTTPAGKLTYLQRGQDGKVQAGLYDENNSMKELLMTALAAAGMGYGINALGGATGASGASGVAGAGASGAGEALAGDLIVDTAGMGLTGPGGIGSAGSVSGAGAGAAGYGGAAAAGGGGGGFLSSVGNFLGSKAGGAVLGAASGLLNGSSKAGEQTATTRQQLDPRMEQIIYGPGGYASRVTGLLDTPQSPGMSTLGSGVDQWLGSNGVSQLTGNMDAAARLRDNEFRAPNMDYTGITKPSQNSIDLAPAYQDFIFGSPGANPHLTGAIQGGINQSKQAFDDMLGDTTRTLTQSILPNIRGGAVLNNQYGSNRQGIAERGALEDFSSYIGKAITRFGQGNTDAAVAAQAGAYDTDRNRSASLLSDLSGKQYGLSAQEAALQQQAAQANLQSQLETNRLNSGNQLAGINAGSGLFGTMYDIGGNQDAYGASRLGQVNSLLSPYTGLNSTTTQSQPLYKNTGANLFGGAMLGAQLGGLFGSK